VCVASLVRIVGAAVGVPMSVTVLLVLVNVAVTVAMRAMRVISPVVGFRLVLSNVLVELTSTYRGSILVRHSFRLVNR